MNSRFCVLAGLLLTTLSISAGAEPRWIQTGNLTAARTYGTATLLPNGKVLVAGGYGGSCDLASAELFDARENAFSPTVSMLQARNCHTATLLRNGKVLVTGGQCNGTTLSESELYDPATRSWTATGSLHIARAYHVATLLSDGRVLVTGDVRTGTPPVFAQGAPPGSALDVAEIYDPASGTWGTTGSMNTARYVHTATVLPGGDVLVTGGMGSRLNDPPTFGPPCNVYASASAEIFHPKTGQWTPTAPMTLARFSQTASLLRNGKVLIAAGQCNGVCTTSAELYDPASGTWKETGSLHTTRNGHTATVLPDGRVLVVGGNYYDGVLRDTEIYDPSTGIWSAGPQLNTPHGLHTATLLRDGTLLVVGGVYAIGLPGYNQISAELYAVNGKTNSTGSSPEDQPATQPALPGVD